MYGARSGDVPRLAAGPTALDPLCAEQIWPARERPRWRDYGMNILISLRPPISLCRSALRQVCGAANCATAAVEITFLYFRQYGILPLAGPALEILAMIFVPLFLHDLWFTGRIESSTRCRCCGRFIKSITATSG